MAQHDYNLANQRGALFRTDLNDALAAIRSSNSGATEPASTLPGQTWFDTSGSEGVLKIRSDDNLSWIEVGYADAVRPSFMAAKSAPQLVGINGWSYLAFPAIVWNDGGYYNTTGSYWAPTKAGRIFLTASALIDGAGLPPVGSNLQVAIWKNGALARRSVEYTAVANAYHCAQCTAELTTAPGDYFQVAVYWGSTVNVNISNDSTATYFTGFML